MGTDNKAFYHRNLELLGLGKQIGQINSGAFGVFSAKLQAAHFLRKRLHFCRASLFIFQRLYFTRALRKTIHFAVLLFGIFFIIGISVGTGNLVKWREREVLMKTLGGLSIVLRSKRCLPKGNCSSTFQQQSSHQGC